MLISKTDKNYITRSDMPNTNWTGEDYYVLDDNSVLAKKIIQYYPRYKLVLSGNEITDVTYIEKTQEELDEERINEILEKLEELDKTVDRQWEDYYIRENVTPVNRIAVAISEKQDLREELHELEGDG